MRLTLTLLAALALAMPAVAQPQGDSMKPAPQPNTYCLGRFLVDLPNDAEIVAQTAEYRNRTYSIEKNGARRLSKRAFQYGEDTP